MSDDRLTVPDEVGGDDDPARTLRPLRLSEFVGQGHVREQLAVFLDAAAARGEPLDHVLLLGPPGLGKTTLAHIIAAETGGALTSVSGPAIDRKGDLAAILTGLGEGDVLFVDEIHRLGPHRRGAAVLGDGGSLDRHHGRAGRRRPRAAPLAAAVHARRRDDALEPALQAPARPLRHELPARALRPRRPRRDRAALGGHPRDRDRRGGRGRDRRPLARHAARREPPAAARARLRPGASRRSHRRRRGACRARAHGRRRRRARAPRPRAAARPGRDVPRSAGRHHDPRGRPRRGRRARSRRCTSRTCCSAGCSSARRRAARSPPRGSSTSGTRTRRVPTRGSSASAPARSARHVAGRSRPRPRAGRRARRADPSSARASAADRARPRARSASGSRTSATSAASVERASSQGSPYSSSTSVIVSARATMLESAETCHQVSSSRSR